MNDYPYLVYARISGVTIIYGHNLFKSEADELVAQAHNTRQAILQIREHAAEECVNCKECQEATNGCGN